MSSNDTDPAPDPAVRVRPTRRPTYWFLVVASALLVGAGVGLALWYFNSAEAYRIAELAPQSTWDWVGLVVVGVILLAMASVLTWLTVSVFLAAHRAENER